MIPGELDRRFKVRAPLRCDGVGSLDCAEDTESGVRMAIRWLPVDANGEEAVKAVQQMPQHPVLPRIRQTGRIGSAAYVAMEFPEGRLLSTMLHAPLVREDVARIGCAVADALSTLHADGLVHGELSCDSVLCLPEGRSILWDAPLVMANRLTDRRGEERTLALLIRQAPFLSPERARGLPASAPGDVYALGALMSLAAGGQPPPGGNTLAVLHQIANRQWTPEIPRGLTPALRALVTRMIDPDPLARPSAREVAEALSERLHTSPTLQEMKAVAVPMTAGPTRTVSDTELEASPLVPVVAMRPPPSAKPAASARAAAPVRTGTPTATATATVSRAHDTEIDALPSIVLEPELEAEAQALRSALWRRRVLTAALILAAVVGMVGVTGLVVGDSGPSQPPARPSAPPVSPATKVAPPIVVPAVIPSPTQADVGGLVAPLVTKAASIKAAPTPSPKPVQKPKVKATVKATATPSSAPLAAAPDTRIKAVPPEAPGSLVASPSQEPSPAAMDFTVRPPSFEPPASAAEELKRPKF